MTNSIDDGARHPQAVVTGDLGSPGALNGRAGPSEFSIGSLSGGATGGANPYELLSASLAACTAMTIQFQARRRKFPLFHVEVAVSYHHGANGSRPSFERSITLEGNLDEDERVELMQAANMCPVGRALGFSADIRTNDKIDVGPVANYDSDLSELPIPNIDPD